jgi:hypothetical protein
MLTLLERLSLVPHRTPAVESRRELTLISTIAARRNFVEANETATRVDLQGGMERRLGTKKSDKTV